MARTARRIGQTLAGLTLVATAVPLVAGAALAETSQVVGLQGGWYWAGQTGGTSVGGAPAPARPVATSGVTPGKGDLAVSYQGAAKDAPDKISALALDLIDVPARATISSFLLTLGYGEGQQQLTPPGAAAPVVACFTLTGWAPAEGENLEKAAPGYDCANAVVPTFDAAASTYTFDITAFAQKWADTGFNNGIALVPAAGSAPFQVVFANASMAKGTVTYEAGAPGTTTSVPSGSGSTTAAPDASSGGSASTAGSGGGTSDFPTFGSESSAGSTSTGPTSVSGSLPPLVSPVPVTGGQVAIAGPQIAPKVVPQTVRTVAAVDLRPDLSPTVTFWLALVGLGGALVATSLYLGAAGAAAVPVPLAGGAAPALAVGTGSPLDRALRARFRPAR